MTATSDTSRNMKQLHRIFAASGVVLLIATVWMLIADHRRQWKSIQRTTDKLQIRSDEWRQMQLRSQEHPLQKPEEVEKSLAERRKLQTAVDEPVELHLVVRLSAAAG